MLYGEGNEESALSHFKTSIEINANHAESHYYTAMIMRSDEDASLAKKHFYKALEINPEYAQAYFELGNHTVNHGDFNEAKLHFQKATDLDQNFVMDFLGCLKTLNYIS